ncbi:MAG: hypothetical protein CME71_11770 [Halobacteriovorax sp.]|nr:hypothetical protein [Halobacteriovorax sp.]
MSENKPFSLADVQPDPSYLNTLSFEDLQRLRVVVRKNHFQQFQKNLSDRDCDKMIASFGPAVREKYIKKQIEEKLSR